MGFLSVLGKIGGGLLGLGGVLGKQQEGEAKGQLSQAQVQQGQDRNAIDLYQAQQGAQNSAGQLDLQRKGFETGNRSATAKQALLGALLSGGLQPTSIKGGQASGGLLRSLNANPEALAAMKTLGQQGSAAQNTPLQFQGGQMAQAPSLTPLPQTGKTSSFLSHLAKLSQLANGALGGGQ